MGKGITLEELERLLLTGKAKEVKPREEIAETLCEMLNGRAYTMKELIAELGRSYMSIASALRRLELKGRVRRVKIGKQVYFATKK